MYVYTRIYVYNFETLRLQSPPTYIDFQSFQQCATDLFYLKSKTLFVCKFILSKHLMRNLVIHKKDTGKSRVRKNPVVLHPGALVCLDTVFVRMLCSCPASQSLSTDLNVELLFLNLVDKKEFIPDPFWCLLKNHILHLRCGLTGWGNRATHRLRRMSFLRVRENFCFKYAS